VLPFATNSDIVFVAGDPTGFAPGGKHDGILAMAVLGPMLDPLACLGGDRGGGK